MKLSELIEKAQKILDREGDLEVFDGEMYSLDHVFLEIAENFPKDWDLPDGTKFVKVYTLH